MKEFIYFSPLDVIVYADYRLAGNTLLYFSSRVMSIVERTIVDQYMLCSFALEKTSYYATAPGTFAYMGVDANIANAMKEIQESKDRIRVNDGDVAAAVSSVIDAGMRNYYFDRIGEALIAKDREKVAVLVKAYNLYTEEKISAEALMKIK